MLTLMVDHIIIPMNQRQHEGKYQLPIDCNTAILYVICAIKWCVYDMITCKPDIIAVLTNPRPPFQFGNGSGNLGYTSYHISWMSQWLCESLCYDGSIMHACITLSMVKKRLNRSGLAAAKASNSPRNKISYCTHIPLNDEHHIMVIDS